MIPQRTRYTVPPPLRVLREAWAWARSQNLQADGWGMDCPRLAEIEPQPGCWSLAGKTVTGGGLAVTIIKDVLQIVRMEDAPDVIRLPLPARYRVPLVGVMYRYAPAVVSQ